MCGIHEWPVNRKSIWKIMPSRPMTLFSFCSVWTKCHTNLHKWYRNWACERKKILGVILSDNLKWNAQIGEIVRKANKTTFFSKTIKKRLAPIREDLIVTYTNLVKPIVECACPLWHAELPQYLQKDVETIQNRPLTTIYELTPYE